MPRVVASALQPDDVEQAAKRIGKYLSVTPLVPSPAIDESVFLKVETLQPTGSFKIRGALAALTGLDRGTSVVTVSSGNHGLGIAYASGLLGVESTVVLPETAPDAKYSALKRFGVHAIRRGSTYDAARTYALSLVSDGRRWVSPYNDVDVVAGQGTVALEILDQMDGDLVIVCPVGGGGLASGVGLWATQRAGVSVVGVECVNSPTMKVALDAGRIVPIEIDMGIADGLGGNLESDAITLDLIRSHVSDVVAVEQEAIADAIRLLWLEHGLVVEGAGAVAVAALLEGLVPIGERPVVALVTGRNISGGALGQILGDRLSA